jgi:hypothetical protein
MFFFIKKSVIFNEIRFDSRFFDKFINHLERRTGMKDSNFYKDQIVELVQNMDDVVFLRRLYKLILIIIKIDDDWMLKQFDKFIDNIRK